jgi:predicted outer membrane repeat protein
MSDFVRLFPKAYGPLGAAALGGAVLDIQATVDLLRVTVANSEAVNVVGGGGGVAAISGATFVVDSSTFTDNTAAGTSFDGPGGAILADAGSTLTVTNSTFSGNRAIDGGAIAVWGAARAA